MWHENQVCVVLQGATVPLAGPGIGRIRHRAPADRPQQLLCCLTFQIFVLYLSTRVHASFPSAHLCETTKVEVPSSEASILLVSLPTSTVRHSYVFPSFGGTEVSPCVDTKIGRVRVF